jgi:hypothetical protein
MPVDLQILRGEWRNLLPGKVVIVAGPISDSTPDLTDGESRSVGTVASARMLELRTGRHYAKEALSLLGIKAVELPVLPDRSPAWPGGTTGSITHVRGLHEGHCAVAVGLTAQFGSIGIDIEYQRTVPPETWPTFLTARELDQIQILRETGRQEDVLCRWCVKESVIKAACMRLDPLAIETEKSGVDGHWYAFGTAVEFRWPVKSSQAEGFVMAAVAVPAESTWALKRSTSH